MIQKEENTLLQKQGLESRAEADERRRVYLTPTAVIWEAGRVSGSKALLENRSVQVGLHNSDCCTLTNDGAAASILLDYGCLLYTSYNCPSKRCASLKLRCAWIDSY